MIVNVSGVPGQPFAAGVMVMVAVTGTLPLFTAVKDGMLPVPLAASPIDVLLLVQLNVVLATDPEMDVALTGDPSQTD